MLEKILLYNVKNPQHIIKAASNMRIICGFINESDTDRTLAEIADDVSIMKDGEIVENGTVEDIFYHPQHSYTKKLLDAVL